MPSDSFRLFIGSLAETRNESENDAEAKQHSKDKTNERIIQTHTEV